MINCVDAIRAPGEGARRCSHSQSELALCDECSRIPICVELAEQARRERDVEAHVASTKVPPEVAPVQVDMYSNAGCK